MAPSTIISVPLAANRPLSTKELSEQAREVAWNPRIPLNSWLRSMTLIYQEGRMYLIDGNYAKAYLLYMRYLTMLLDVLPKHPEAKTPEGKKRLEELTRSSADAFANLERIKPIVQREYDSWVSDYKKQEGLRLKQQADRAKAKPQSAYDERASRDPALSSAARLLDASDHQDLAVELAQKEIRRRQNKRAAGYWENWPSELAEKRVEDEDDFQSQMQSTRKTLDGSENGYKNGSREDRQSAATTGPKNVHYRYPSIAKSEPVYYEALQPSARRTPTPQPPRPPKEGLPQWHEPIPNRPSAPLIPELPAKVRIPSEREIPTPDIPQELPTLPPKIHEDSIEPPKKEQRTTFKPAAYLESGEPVRSIFLPSQLRHKFLSMASENTRRGLEMCGILCGTLVNNALFVRCLLIPEQKCTSDTCETENENSMLEYCMNEDLLILGWIHTHPTQTCFMSSRDLHTQAGYQVMLPESIAIVCAPKFQPSFGIFRLTHPPGLDHILSCTQSATFHPHSIDNLYTQAQRPAGHVLETDKMDFYVHDLRPGARNTVQHKNF